MRNRTKYALFSGGFILLAGLFLLLPHLLSLDRIREQIIQEVSASLASSVQVEEIHWAWLPLPHVSVRGGLLENQELKLTVPRAKVYPSWRSLFGGQIRISRVVLDSPDFLLKELTRISEVNLLERIPDLDISVVNGSLHVAAPSPWPQISSREFSITAIKASAKASPKGITFAFSGTPDFGELLRASGEVRRDGSYYKMNLDCRDLKLHKVINSFANDLLQPVDSLLNVKGNIEGRGNGEIKARIFGEFPCLLAFPADKKILLNCGVADFSFTRSGPDLKLTVHRMEMREPGFTLAGTIGRSSGPEESSPPVWDIALNGEDLNLTGIREAVLAMWGDNETVREVTDIVLAGTTGKAAYAFKGTATDLADVRNMEISANDINATIKLPVGELVLTETRGGMRIMEGKLIVQGKSARLGNSTGSNCDLVLGLSKEDHTLLLDVDLDADLAELPALLPQLIHSQPFLKELSRFRGISGRASGRLHLGDHLKDLKVRVEVASMKGRAGHAALPRDFSLAGGRLSITGKKVQWVDVRGTYGQHRIERSSGEVRLNDQTLLRLSRLDGAFSGPELLAGSLSFLPQLDTALKNNLSRLDGVVRLRDTTIEGIADNPSSWQIHTSLILDGLVLASPHLPALLRIQKGRARSSGERFVVQECLGVISGDSFALSADLSRGQSRPWLGTISLRGRLGQQSGSWLKKKKIIPPAFFPRLPLQVDSLNITLAADKTTASGLVIAEAQNGLPARAEFSTEFARDSSPVRAAFRVSGKGEAAAITFDSPEGNMDTLRFSWKGKLSDKTVTQLLDQERLLQGAVVSGDFQLHRPKDPGKTSFTGELQVRGLRWPWPGKPGRHVDFREISLSGTGQELQIKKLSCAFSSGETLQAKGLLTRLSDGLGLKLALSSPSLSQEMLADLASDLKNLGKGAGQGTTGQEKTLVPWNKIRGTIRFDVAEFVSRLQPGPDRKLRPTPLIFKPLQGEVRLYPGWRMATTISSGQTCCLQVKGDWFSDPVLGQNSLALRTTCPESPPRFEQVLPCLGFPQDLIEGAFSLEGRLSGTPDNWQEGMLDVHSSAGRILRWKLLSQIFSVVNITDLFSAGPQENGQDLSRRGFPYSELILKTRIRNNELIIDEAVVRGQGLNLFARGKMNISTLDMDFVVLVAPLKTIDAIVARIPLLGKVIGGETATVVTFPVAVRGNIKDPQVTLLPPSAVGEGIINMVKRTLLLPFTILSPILPDLSPGQEKK